MSGLVCNRGWWTTFVEKMSNLEGKDDETKRLLIEMCQVMVEQQQRIRTLQKQEALRQVSVASFYRELLYQNYQRRSL